MNIIIFQMDIVPGEPEANHQRVKEWFQKYVDEASPRPDIIMLPEMWTTAYTLPDLQTLAEDPEGPSLQLLQELAQNYNVNIVGGSIAVKIENLIYNRAIVIDRQGTLIYHYDKLHLVPMLEEPDYLEGGKAKVQTFILEGVRMGIVICFDLRFPEIIRQLALQNAQVLFIPAEWPEARASHWEILSTARAIENQMYVVTCNRIGIYNGVQFAGRSMFIDPWGTTLAKGSSTNEEVLQQSLDLSSVPSVRANVPIFESRVPDFY